MIIAAAVISNDGHVYALPPPARHHTIMHMLGWYKDFYGLIPPNKQGFIDDKLGYVDRKTAAKIAVEEGQIERLNWPPELFSEDLW